MSIDQVAQLVDRYRKLKAKQDNLKRQADEIKRDLQPLVEAVGKWTDDIGYARMIQRNPSISYDSKALDALCASFPELAEKLTPHRKERTGSKYLQVK